MYFHENKLGQGAQRWAAAPVQDDTALSAIRWAVFGVVLLASLFVALWVLLPDF